MLINVKADESVAVFSVMQEGETPAICGQKMDATIFEFTRALKELGVSTDDLFVDFVAQNRTFGFEIMGDVARESSSVLS